MEAYAEENMDNFTPDELSIISETITENKDNFNNIRSFFVSSFANLLAIVAFFIAAFLTFYSALAAFLLDAGDKLIVDRIGSIFNVLAGVAIIYLLGFTYYFFKKTREYKNIVKLQEAIKILIAIIQSKSK
ncbi:hypothetical protein ACIQYL_04435 [Lysinibacillus xylanilyticus]|uniref:hypothetical protein n=1 Tax=Lysinibacillus xylanilyticus TaxID=582475 RepID=UPI0037F500A6